jgi:hypothetical protein
MKMGEEYSPEWEMKAGIDTTLNGGTKNSKVLSAKSRPIYIPNWNTLQFFLHYMQLILRGRLT